ncbi:MAG: rhodanese-related sulfurtransferase [Spirulinaceae cyanobacterium RM2_2_10]|nr:rhodanese-related sulfurtransferase [Spirulinaceae cyanobacterium RM2_2_10]
MPAPEPIVEVSVRDFAAYLAQAATPPQLIDVREPQEVAIAHIENFAVLPLSQFEQWSPTIHDRFDPTAATFVLCHHGMRSAQMCYWLRSQGFSNVKNITGGIDAYAIAIDPTIRQY